MIVRLISDPDFENVRDALMAGHLVTAFLNSDHPQMCHEVVGAQPDYVIINRGSYTELRIRWHLLKKCHVYDFDKPFVKGSTWEHVKKTAVNSWPEDPVQPHSWQQESTDCSNDWPIHRPKRSISEFNDSPCVIAEHDKLNSTCTRSEPYLWVVTLSAYPTGVK